MLDYDGVKIKVLYGLVKDHGIVGKVWAQYDLIDEHTASEPHNQKLDFTALHLYYKGQDAKEESGNVILPNGEKFRVIELEHHEGQYVGCIPDAHIR